MAEQGCGLYGIEMAKQGGRTIGGTERANKAERKGSLCVVIILDRSYPPLPTKYRMYLLNMRFNQC